MTRALEAGVVITMAGAGSRFVQAGYLKPKYEVEAHGRTLFEWSMHSLQSYVEAGCPFTFIALDRPGVDSFIERECRNIGIRLNAILKLNGITDGQATTAMLARDSWDHLERPVAIYNIDTYVRPSAIPVTAIRGNAWIPCFPGEGDKWSFAAADSNGKVSEVREKRRISPHASVGLYWFDSFQRYASAYEEYYANPEHLEVNERYIAPLYNQVISEGGEVYLHEIGADDVFPLGTPEDVEAFRAKPQPVTMSATNTR